MEFRFLLDDITISLTDRIEDLKEITFQDQFIQLNPTQFIIYIPGMAKIRASEGKKIEIEPLSKPIDQKGIELYLNGSVLSAILYQRGILAFHGSSFEHNNRAVLICGDSGAGKSTTTLAFCLTENKLFLTDDITPVLFDDNKVMVWPISERLKIWKDTLEKLDIDAIDLEQVRENIDKYFVERKEASRKVPLQIILFLRKENIHSIQVREIEGAERLQFLIEAMYRKEFFEGMKQLQVSFFDRLVRIAESIRCVEIIRPESSEINDLISKIHTIIQE